MQKLPEHFISDIQALMDMINPGSMLLAGDKFVDELADIAADKNISNVKTLSGNNLYSRVCGLGVFDLVILTDIAAMEKQPAMQLIGRIRDFHARHLLVMQLTEQGRTPADNTETWQRQDFIACGMRLFNKYSADSHDLHVYRFELSDYKVTPEWFNSKYWANPELFDKYRW